MKIIEYINSQFEGRLETLIILSHGPVGLSTTYQSVDKLFCNTKPPISGLQLCFKLQMTLLGVSCYHSEILLKGS